MEDSVIVSEHKTAEDDNPRRSIEEDSQNLYPVMCPIHGSFLFPVSVTIKTQFPIRQVTGRDLLNITVGQGDGGEARQDGENLPVEKVRHLLAVLPHVHDNEDKAGQEEYYLVPEHEARLRHSLNYQGKIYGSFMILSFFI